MKKILVLLMAFSMVIAFTACGGNTDAGSSNTQNKEEENGVIEVSGGDYEELLAGGLNEEQFAFILSHSPSEMAEGGYTMDYLAKLLLYMSDILSGGAKPYISITGWTEDYDANMHYNLVDVNNMIKIVTDFQFSEENNGECSGATVSGEKLSFCFATPSKGYSAEIKSAVIEDDVMTVVYKVHVSTFEDGEWDEMRTAVLKKNGDDLYQIQTITTDEILIPTWQEQYEAKIKEYQGYADGYALHDMDGDDIPELIFQTQDPDFMDNYNWAMYTCSTENGFIKEVYCSYATGLRSATWLNPFGEGLVEISTNPWNGQTFYTHLYVSYGELEEKTLTYFTWEQEKEMSEYHANFKKQLEWHDMSTSINKEL